jgi:hypothetical protein
MNSPNISNNKAINTDEAIKAAKFVLSIAKNEGVKSAICGGLAMHLYGFTRATKDIDFVASGKISIEFYRELSFGGLAYKCELDGKEYEIDWILRNDEQRYLYDGALNDLVLIGDDSLPIVSPEWMVIIKHVAGRGKDHMDCVWLLRQDGLVDREKLFGIIKKIMGPHAFWAIKDLESVILEADLMRARDENNDK